MKKFKVGIDVPAFADLNVLADDADEAISKVKKMIENGDEIDIFTCISKASDDDYYVKEISATVPDRKSDNQPKLMHFTVVLEALAEKKISVQAESSEAAEAFVLQMYCRSKMLDFTEDDVTSVSATVEEDEEDTDEGFMRFLDSILGAEDEMLSKKKSGEKR